MAGPNKIPDFSYKRNTIHNSRFIKIMDGIKGEERAAMRLLQTAQSQFHKQFRRYKRIPPSAGSEAKNVRMFDTHTPGFCYKRNGDMRSTQFCAKEAEVHDFKDIRELLFSNGEVDIGKVMCLHLLAAHFVQNDFYDQDVGLSSSEYYLKGSSSSIMIIPRNPQSRQKSSTVDECLLRRSILMPALTSAMKNARDEIMMVNEKNTSSPSERKSIRSSSYKCLPSYVIATKAIANMYDEIDNETDDETDDMEDTDESLENIYCKPKRREIAKVQIYFNKEIERLVDSVLDVLLEVNPDKAQEIIKLARNPVLLKNIVTRPEIQQFIKSLFGNTLVSGWDSFEVHPGRLLVPRVEVKPRKTMGELRPVYVIEIADTIPNLKQLVSEIRGNVLYEARKSCNQKPFEDSAPLQSNDSLKHNFKIPNKDSYPSREAEAEIVIPQSSISGNNTNKKKSSAKSEVSKVLNYRASMSSDSFNSNRILDNAAGFTITSFTGFVTPQFFPSNEAFNDISIREELSDDNVDKLLSDNFKNVSNGTVKENSTTAKPTFLLPSPKNKCSTKKRPAIILPNLKAIEEPLKKFKDGLLNDQFLKGRDYEHLLEQLRPRAPNNEKQRIDFLNSFYASRFKPDLDVGFHRKKSKTLSEEREELEQNFYDHMTPLQRMHVFRQLSALKNSLNDRLGSKIIPFASYVIPVLSQKSVMKIVNNFNEREKKLVFMPEKEGGLGMPKSYIDNPKATKPALKIAKIRDLNSDNTKLNAKLTDLDLAKLKCEIAEQETHKKYLQFLAKPVPD